ncbi:Glycosyltransferase family 92 protein [Caenorhabditis elegans]|uniref:Glycosyltransferase family 92 protein n=1 Tax=Caenorhabditis elegans TaxID=6239 RepID=A0A7R9SV75_CAEEL|nr:Glycosyltransferase family 92 protein [Caenorhabditis elegans]CAD8106946.1 Glycosyltransferase family 92 protein [Caenorhabditis elegans]
MNSDTKLNNFQFKPYSVLYEQLIIRCRTLYLFVILLAFVHISIHPLPALRRVRNSYTNKIKELDNDEKDLFFVSAYYYGVGYSLYKNQVTLTFIAPRDAHWERRKIIAIRSDDTKTVLEPLQIHRATPHNLCKYVTLVGTIVLEEELTELELLVNGHTAKIRYLPADNKPKDLVVCTPPIYNNVRWQNVLLAAHVYTSFGGHLQTYVATTSRPFFEFLEELKRLKGISVDSFPDFYGKSKLDGIEFGGVTVANSDCLNKYKNHHKSLNHRNSGPSSRRSLYNKMLKELHHLLHRFE